MGTKKKDIAPRSIRMWGAGVAVLAMLPGLTGCVAAAIPVLAATGVVGKTAIDGDAPDRTTQRGEPRVAVDLSPQTAEITGPADNRIVQTRQYADGSQVSVTMARPAPASRTSVVEQSPAVAAMPPSARPALADVANDAVATGGRETLPAPGSSFVLADGTRATVMAGPLPAPGVSLSGAAAADYRALAAYVSAQGALPLAGQQRMSAMLANPGTLAPVTRECSIHPPALLVDIDPARGTFAPSPEPTGDPALAATLSELRDQGLAILWLSGVSADRAGAIRSALRASGLDPAGRDPIAVLRYPDERKQTRREDLAKEYCIVAVAGDERADFDELYGYLRNPQAAGPLDGLLGNGWFLIPQPIG